MSNLMLFSFEKFPVRVVMVNGEPWFVAADVYSVLALSNVSQAVSRLDSDEQRDITIDDVTGRPQLTVCINESGLYSLTMTSRKACAKRFKKWVTS